jgi:ABC-type iron transport system FetAB ATPase subunit
MRIRSISITNFKALKCLEISDAPDLIVLAGPNGCGKTCVFDAIRLLKSAYGGYIANETQSWLNEFGVTYKPGYIDAKPLLHDATSSLNITAAFAFSASEIEFLRGDITELIRDITAQESRDAPFHHTKAFQTLAAQSRQGDQAILAASQEIQRQIATDLGQEHLTASLTIHPDGSYQLQPSRLLELVFSTFKLGKVGVIDFQNSSRVFRREPSGSIQITIDQTVDETGARARNHSLYNHDQRYSNLKQQLATAYVKALISAKAGHADPERAQRDLTETLQDLFATFIPGKTFLGPIPSLTGTLRFDVRTSSGGTHDINDLSTGEKEVLYGYLLLRNRTPTTSILMIDEPEAHLNPRLVTDLPAFYFRHLGAPLGNQIWLVTHSDAIVRGAISTPAARVFHVQPAEPGPALNQVTPVLGDTEMQALVLSLVGDLAAYRPTAPVVILEGGADSEDASEFDAYVVGRLFPDFSRRVNLVSGHDKQRVHQIHDALLHARSRGLIAQDVYSIVDRDDALAGTEVLPPNKLVWNCYHIENFLLVPKYILEALIDISAGTVALRDIDEVVSALRQCAHAVAPQLVSHRVINSVRSGLVRSIQIGCDPSASDLVAALQPSLTATRQRLDSLWASQLSAASMSELIASTQAEVQSALNSDAWLSDFPGREILRIFAARHARIGQGHGISYMTLRNSILSRMAAARHRPPAMLATLRVVCPDLSTN